MMGVHLDLTTVWAFIIAFAVFLYVVMDGFDLGIGILFPTFKVGSERDAAMNAIAPVWDGNETWLVLGGGGLLAAFPLAYGVILTATYPLVIAMLLGLVFRGVAFEFRWRDPRHRAGVGSGLQPSARSLPPSAQGDHARRDPAGRAGRAAGAYGGGWLDWLSPFSSADRRGVWSIAYALLGATWLVWQDRRRNGQDHARRLARIAGDRQRWPRSSRSARRRRFCNTPIGSAGS